MRVGKASSVCTLLWLTAATCALSSCTTTGRQSKPAEPINPSTTDNSTPQVDRQDNAIAADQQQQAVSQPPPARDHWPFRPTTVRLHPLTHVVKTPDGQRTIEARVEFSDSFGDGTKAVGQVRFELVPTLTDGDTSPSAPIAVWETNLADLEQNARRYDPVTRTYLFRLTLDKTLTYQRTMSLRVQVQTPRRKLNAALDVLID